MSVFPNSVSAVVTLVEKLALGATNEPLMSVDICAELDNIVLLNSDSVVVILVEKLPLSVAKLLADSSVNVTLVEKLALGAVKEPLISLDICAEPDNKVFPNSDSAVVTLVEKLALGATNEPLMSVAI